MKYLLRACGLSRSVFYYWLAKHQRPDPYEEDKALIRAVFADHRARYGYRRVTLALRTSGSRISHKKVQRLMQELGLRSKVRRKRYVSYRGKAGKVADNLLCRQFSALGPNEKWVTDVTEFNVKGEKLYLSPILDLFSQEIVTYRISRSPSSRMVNAMLDEARRRLEATQRPLLHSDQGWQYQMASYRQRLHQSNMQQSMSRKGNCLDNAVMENFFGHLKSECFKGESFESLSDLEAELHDYIDYYNNRRIKAKLKGLSPVIYRTQALGQSFA